MRLPPRKTASVALRTFPEDQYWRLLYPSYDVSAHRLAAGSVACTGQPVLSDATLKDGTPTRGGWPLETQEGDITFGAGGDHLRVIWLRSHKFPDGTVGGAIALTRVLDDFAEVYAIGVHRGPPGKTRLGLERLAGDLVVTLQDDTCTNRPPNTPCESRLRMLIARRGQLHEVAAISLEQVGYAIGTESSEPGRVEYHLTSSPRFTANGLKLMEQVQVYDSHSRVLRKAELERVFKIDGDKPMQVNEAPLWPRIFPKSGAAPAASGSASP